MSEDEWVWIEVQVPEREGILGTRPAHTERQRHLRSCVERQARYERELAEFEVRYSGYCRACGGTGIVEYMENGAPHGAGYWPMPVVEACEACDGRCPRCGEEFDVEWYDGVFATGDAACPACGFVVGARNQETAPWEPECECWRHEEWGSSGG